MNSFFPLENQVNFSALSSCLFKALYANSPPTVLCTKKSIRCARRGVIRLLTSMTGACDLLAGPIFRLDIITLLARSCRTNLETRPHATFVWNSVKLRFS